jgi:hypothetical protein
MKAIRDGPHRGPVRQANHSADVKPLNGILQIPAYYADTGTIFRGGLYWFPLFHRRQPIMELVPREQEINALLNAVRPFSDGAANSALALGIKRAAFTIFQRKRGGEQSRV